MNLITLILTAALATAGVQAAPDISYKVTVAEPHKHIFQVEMTLSGLARDEIEVSMPVWIPGSYLVREFERQVDYFAPFDAAGKPLSWRKVDKNTWKIACAGAETVRIDYNVYAREPGIRWCFVYDEGGHIIGPALFMYLVGGEDLPVSARFVLPEGWKLEGGIAPESGDPFLLTAPSYHELVDAPMLIGHFDIIEFEVAGVPHFYTILGRHDADREKLVADTKKIIEADLELFGELPYDRYAFTVMTICGGGGIEHRTGTSLGVFWVRFSDETLYGYFLDTVSHEFFHAWNVKSIRPPELKVYNYEEETYFDSLWWYEGITSYYDDRMLLRCGLIDREKYLQNVKDSIEQYRSTPGRLNQSAAESSFDAWVKAYRSDENSYNVEISYYSKGSIVGMLLDLEIAKRTGGEKGLDDVIRTMWRRTRDDDAAFGTDDIRALCEEVAGGSFAEIFEKHVYGTEEVPFEDYLALAGYELKIDEEKTEERNATGYLGAAFSESDGRLKVSLVRAGSAAWRDGLNYDDEIIALNGIRLYDNDDLTRELKPHEPGEQVEFLIERHGKVRTVEVTLDERPVPIYKIEEMEEPSEEQLAVRARWLQQPPAEEEEQEEEQK